MKIHARRPRLNVARRPRLRARRRAREAGRRGSAHGANVNQTSTALRATIAAAMITLTTTRVRPFA